MNKIKTSALITASAACAVLPAVSCMAATDFTDTVQITIESACSLAVTEGSGTYAKTLQGGTDTGDIKATTVKVTCNDANGWKINAIGSGTGATKTDMVPTISSIEPIHTMASTSTKLDGTTSAWGMKISVGTGTGTTTPAGTYANYSPVPSTSTKVVSGTTTDQTTGANFTTYYKVSVTQAQPADTYTGKVTYTLTHPGT